jgi:adenosylcobalamin-dependent ribonucleoside-triphosphate reductase
MDIVGHIVFTRTYARKVNPDDPESPVETWVQTINRVLNACDRQLHVGFTPEEKEEAFNLIHSLKMLPAGRFLWQLGTETVDRLGLLSLQNCAFCVIDAPVRPFTWTMDCLMLGCGVGFNLAPEHVAKIPHVKPTQIQVTRLDTKDADFIVPDSREGWVKLLGKLLKAHFYSGKSFTYSTTLLRSSGAAIKGFGGSASGPEILCKGINLINQVLNQRAGRALKSVDALDIMNIIAMIVVAGNVRRSAQVALGVAEDKYFLRAKRWDFGNIPNWRCNSNNSILCNNIDELPSEFWDGYQGNGEPYGLLNLPLSRSCGRLGELQYPDPDVQGGNPCMEQCLSAFETCALGELVLPRMESKEELFRCAQLLYRMIKHSLRLPCHHPETEAIVHKNMRMGLGITGYLQATEEQRSWLSETYVKLREYDVEYSRAHGWPTSIKLTTVKPSGTLSLLAGCTSGVHPGYARQYIRRIRFAADSKLVPLCRSHGYHVEFVRQFDGSVDRSTVVVEFPYKLPDSAIIASQVTALDQLNFVKRMQTEWSDNAVSCCLVGNTLIHTHKGFRYLADICKKGRILPSPSPMFTREEGRGQFYRHNMQVVSAEGSIRKSDAYYHNGYALTVTVGLSNGSKLEGTRNHKVQVLDEETREIVWRELSSVTMGTYVVSRLGLDIWPESQSYTLTNQSVKLNYWASVFAVNMLPENHFTETTSEQFFESVAYFLEVPWTWSDCCTCKLENVLETKWGSLYRGVPRFVLQGTREVVLRYLSMVWFLTHKYHKDKVEFTVSSPYRTASVLQTLLVNLGIPANIVPCREVDGRYNLLVCGRDAVTYLVTLFKRDLSVFEERMVLSVRHSDFEFPEEAFVEGQDSAGLCGFVPNMRFRQEFREVVLPSVVSKEFKRRMETVCEHHDHNLDRQTLAQFYDLGLDISQGYLLDTSFMFHRVTSVVLGDVPQKTFDVSVPVSNSYLVQGGIVSHNTVYYRREELPAIKSWLSANYENGVKTCSFLLHSDHGFDQAPLEEITLERYNEMVAQCRPFEVSSPAAAVLSTTEDDVLDVECASGACPVR